MIPVVEDDVPRPLRYVIRKDKKWYLNTPPGGQELEFGSLTIVDAIKFATAEDAQTLIRHLFDVPVPVKWDAAKAASVPDPDAPVHLGKFLGQDKSGLEIVSTHT